MSCWLCLPMSDRCLWKCTFANLFGLYIISLLGSKLGKYWQWQTFVWANFYGCTSVQQCRHCTETAAYPGPGPFLYMVLHLTLSPPEYFDMLNHRGGGRFCPLVKDGLWWPLRPLQRPKNGKIWFLTSSSTCRIFELSSMFHRLAARWRRSSLVLPRKFAMWKS